MIRKNAFDAMLLEMGKSLEKIERTLRILQVILNSQPIGISRLSEATGLPDHVVRYSLRLMQRDGIIEPSKAGAIVSPEFLDRRSVLIDRIRKMSERVDALKTMSETLLSGHVERKRVAEKEDP